ncbi:hypothetical protein LINGRAHAP2_LOCUS6393 [Linum grandiflorum]
MSERGESSHSSNRPVRLDAADLQDAKERANLILVGRIFWDEPKDLRQVERVLNSVWTITTLHIIDVGYGLYQFVFPTTSKRSFVLRFQPWDILSVNVIVKTWYWISLLEILGSVYHIARMIMKCRVRGYKWSSINVKLLVEIGTLCISRHRSRPGYRPLFCATEQDNEDHQLLLVVELVNFHQGTECWLFLAHLAFDHNMYHQLHPPNLAQWRYLINNHISDYIEHHNNHWI